MNHSVLKTISALFLLNIVCITGCLKDSDYDKGLIQSTRNSDNTNQNIVEIKLTAGSSDNVLITAFDVSNVDTTLNFVPVNLASPNAAPQDVNVTLTQDNSIVDNYNSANGTNFTVPDPSTYTVVNPNMVVTIPKGSHTGYLQVKLNPSNFVGGDWALGYTISKVDPSSYIISGNLASGMVGFGIKNKYDGHYQVMGTLIDNANATIIGKYPMDVFLITQGSSSVAMFDNAIGTYAHSISVGGGLSYYGNFAPVFTFDASDKIQSVTNFYGQPSSNGRSAQVDESGANVWNSSDNSIDAKYFMLQPSVIVPYRTSFDEHFTYLGPR